MLKRLLLSVLVLGLVFTAVVPAMAEKDLNDLDAIGPIDISTGRNLAKHYDYLEVNRGDAIAYTGQPVHLGKAADVCEDYRSRGFRWYFGGTIFDGAVYFAYQDMETVCPTPYTMEVTTAWMAMVTHGSAGTAQFHAEVWSADLSDPSCPVPGSPMVIGPTVTYAINAGTAGMAVEIPLAASPYDYACVDGPYFIAVVPGPQSAGVLLGAWASDDVNPGQFCVWYWQNVTDPSISDFAAYFWDGLTTLDLNLSSYAKTSDQNDCHLPGLCGWNYWHCGYGDGSLSDFAMPSISGSRDKIWTQFESASPCTILQVDLYYGSVRVGDPGLRISIFDDDGGYPGNEIVGEDFTPADYDWVSANFAADQPVIVPVGKYYVMASRRSDATDADTTGIILSTPGTCDVECRSGVTGNTGVEQYFCDLYGAGSEYNMVTEVYTCCAQPKTCEPGPGIPDDWSTYAHDFARTSRSSMALGASPCDIQLNWKRNTPRAGCVFNNVSAAGGKVFASDDQSLNCFDLAYGTVDGTPGGIQGPIWTYYDPLGVATAGGMRNNITVAGGYCYGSGGAAQSFFKLDTAKVDVLPGPPDGIQDYVWSRHYNSHGNGAADMLGATIRFSVSVVIGSKVIVATEGGRLYCLNNADGTNHTDWSTNPVLLTGAIMHSPAYDGAGNLYVATAVGGRIYKVSLANGTSTLIFTEPDGDGFTAGVSYDADEDVLYAASRGTTPMRFKLTTTGSVVWQFAQGNVIYGAPTVDGKKVYFGQDSPAQGLLVVDKFTGAVEYNFAVDGVGMVTGPVTATADCYLFAGDRTGGWHLVNSQTSSRIWSRHFQDFVWGTALIHHDLENKDYAVMSIWSDYMTGFAYGGVFCWELNAAPRPMLEQYVTEVNIPVPFGSGGPNPGAAPDAFANLSGCGALTISGTPVYDLDPPLISELKAKITQGNPKSAMTAGKVADQLAGDDYLSFFEESRAEKAALMNGSTEDVTAEDFGRHQSKINFDRAKNSRSLAAGAATLRTFNVAVDVASPIPGGTTFGLTWDWDGSGLERSVSSDFIELVNDDPDFYPEMVGYGYYPGITVNYVGGCLYEWFEDMYWNGYEMWHLEQVSNYGRTGDGTGYGLDWGDGVNDAPIYDGGFILAQVGADYAMTTIFDQTEMADRFLPNPSPMSGVCGIDYADYVPLGRSVVVDWNAGGGCPPVLDVDYLNVEADVSWTSFIDSAAAYDYTLGTNITQVEISAYDFGDGYGDLKLYHYKVEERNGVSVPDLVAGMFHDWDMQPSSARNSVVIAADAGGYAVWDSGAPTLALGQMVLGGVPSLTNSSLVEGVQYRALVGGANGYSVYNTTCVQCCTNSDLEWMDCIDNYWFGAFVETDIGSDAQPHGDKHGLFLWPEFTLAPNGEQHLYCATFGVDASSNDRTTVENNIRSMAFRANKWAGFNRGDVNDDNVIDAIDVAYLYGVVNGSGWPVFPYNDSESTNGGNGDVNFSGATDGADVTYLMNYLMGGPAPMGGWRFSFMP
jgi:hypothetical protein